MNVTSGEKTLSALGLPTTSSLQVTNQNIGELPPTSILKIKSVPFITKQGVRVTPLLQFKNASNIGVSNSPNSSQHSTTPLVKSEVPNVVFRRKRGGKRRRMVNKVLLPRERLVENHEAGSDTQPKTNCSDEEKEANANVGENVIYTKKGGKTLLKCGYCGRTFKFLSQFVIHQRIHTGERPFKFCQYCGKSFPFQSALIRHVRVHTGEKPYKCDICGKAFGQAYFLRVHELTHWSVKRYNCTHCEKSFTHYSNAKNHSCRPLGSDDNAQEHRRPKPSLTYTCHICKNVFDHLQEFNTHMREHTGAKLYRSLVAAASCETQKKQPQIIRKKRSNNLKKPFQSTVIPAHSLSHLVSKLNKVDNRSDPRRYLCPNCGRLFRHMGRLRAHMLTHAPGQSYTCACCGKTLGSWKKFKLHSSHSCRGVH
uniref:C2H2-type domain-containing protein n=1 Tax=Maylandia zebra TaxID=106582 RepID=A0A3P9DH86_9CICH